MNGNKKKGILTTTAVPEIINITPNEGSAGTKTQLTILGTNFGNKSSNYSTADVIFYSGMYLDINEYYASGRQDTDYNKNEIINWTDTRIEVNVPFGYLIKDGIRKPCPVSSGYIYAITDENQLSEKYPFTVPFSFGRQKWNSNNISYYVNANNNTDFLNAINAAADSWNAVVPSKFHLHYNGVSTKTERKEDGVSLIFFGPLTDDSFASALCYQGSDEQIVEADIIINSSKNWSITTANESTANLQSVMLHEFGHWLNLRDLCGNLNSPYPNDIYSVQKVMYYARNPALGNWNLVTLSDPDKAGLSWIYDHPAPVIDAIYPATGENSASIPVKITGSNYMSMTDSDLTVTLSR